MCYRALTKEELRALRPGDLVNVELPGGKILSLPFVSFGAGGINGDTFVRLLAPEGAGGEKFRAVDPDRLKLLNG
jgi:hypothetical protein